MFARILKKDLKRKKGINVILFLFILIATVFLASSTNNMLVVSNATEYFMDKANIPDEIMFALHSSEGTEQLREWLDGGAAHVFQQMYMLKNLTIYDNIILPEYQSKSDKGSKKEINERGVMLMKKLGISEIAENDINEVSGGQLQQLAGRDGLVSCFQEGEGSVTVVDILLVEDNEELGSLVAMFMKKDGYSVQVTVSGEKAMDFLAENSIKLLLLDIMLPGMDGFAVCTAVRKHGTVPILIMSAIVDKQGQELELNSKEYELLVLLMKNKGKTLNKDYLFDQVWGADSFSESQTLTVHMKRIRDKIEADPKNPKHIRTVWGVGYQFEKV